MSNEYSMSISYIRIMGMLHTLGKEGAVYSSRVTRSLKTFCSCSKNLDDQTRSGFAKTVDSEAVLEVIEKNQTEDIQKLSGELVISYLSVVRCLQDLGKRIQSY